VFLESHRPSSIVTASFSKHVGGMFHAIFLSPKPVCGAHACSSDRLSCGSHACASIAAAGDDDAVAGRLELIPFFRIPLRRVHAYIPIPCCVRNDVHLLFAGATDGSARGASSTRLKRNR